MWEDIYQVYRLIGNEYKDLLASDMTIDNAVLFAKAWLSENYNDQQSTIGISRQPCDYVSKKTEVANSI